MQPTRHKNIKKYATKDGFKYAVRYRQPNGKQTMKRGFSTIRAAERWLHEIEHSKTQGVFISEANKARKLNDFIEEYFKTYKPKVRASTYQDSRSVWDHHVQKRWGETPLNSITTGDIELWVASIDRSPTLVRRAHSILKNALQYAVKQRWLAVNPAYGVELPKPSAPPRRYLTGRELQAVIENTPTHYRVLVMLLGYAGLRWGEATALLVKDVDGAKVRIEKSVKRVNGEWVISPPKTGKSRVVVVPGFLARYLDEQAKGKGLNDLLFPRKGENDYMWLTSRSGNTNKVSWWEQALENAGVEYLRIHDLRHTAASLAIHAGANVKVVQRMLGHASAAMTLDVYADLFDEDLYEVASVLDSSFGSAWG